MSGFTHLLSVAYVIMVYIGVKVGTPASIQLSG